MVHADACSASPHHGARSCNGGAFDNPTSSPARGAVRHDLLRTVLTPVAIRTSAVAGTGNVARARAAVDGPFTGFCAAAPQVTGHRVHRDVAIDAASVSRTVDVAVSRVAFDPAGARPLALALDDEFVGAAADPLATATSRTAGDVAGLASATHAAHASVLTAANVASISARLWTLDSTGAGPRRVTVNGAVEAIGADDVEIAITGAYTFKEAGHSPNADAPSGGTLDLARIGSGFRFRWPCINVMENVGIHGSSIEGPCIQSISRTCVTCTGVRAPIAGRRVARVRLGRLDDDHRRHPPRPGARVVLGRGRFTRLRVDTRNFRGLGRTRWIHRRHPRSSLAIVSHADVRIALRRNDSHVVRRRIAFCALISVRSPLRGIGRARPQPRSDQHRDETDQLPRLLHRSHAGCHSTGPSVARPVGTICRTGSSSGVAVHVAIT